MSTFIDRDVLKSFEKTSITDLNDTKKTIAKLTNEISKNKEKIKCHIEKKFNHLNPDLEKNKAAIQEGENHIEEAKNLIRQYENETKRELDLSACEINGFNEEIQEILLGMKTSHKLLKIDGFFNQLDAAKKQKDTLLQLELIGKLKSLIYDGSDKILPKLICFQNIKIRFNTESELMIYNLNQQFEELVQMKEDNNLPDKTVTLKISKDENRLKNIIIGLFNAKYNPTKICSFLLNNVFDAIVKTTVSINIVENEDCRELILSYKTDDKDSESKRPDYRIVLENILTIFEFLSCININFAKKINVFQIFGKCMKNKFLDLIISKCLVNYIYDVSKDMRNSVFLTEILKFNEALVAFRLLDATSDKELIEFVDNVVMLSKNRFHKKCFDEAVVIMKKDLYNMTLADDDSTQMKNNFPKCMISKSILELFSLFHKIIEEEDEKTFSIICSIIDHYMSDGPIYHEKMLQSIPQQTALFYNNTMFLSQWLISNFDDKNSEVQNLCKSLHSLAEEYFAKQVENQYFNLNTILRDFDISEAVSELGPEPQKRVRQCLRQLDLLKNVWQTILPDDLYNQTISKLIDEFCEKLIKSIMIIEDISSAVSTELVEIIGIVEERVPRLFQDKNQVIMVKVWTKLKQLKQILNANLAEIVDMWAEGVGPLSLNFKAEEVKQLIRALFQNTERRSNALSSIV